VNQQPPQQQWAPPPQPPRWGQEAGQPGRSSRLADFFMFRSMITPSLVVVIYVIGVIGITLFALFGFAYTSTADGSAVAGIVGAIIVWIVAQLYLRVVMEVLIVLFRLYESVRNIDRKTREG
jgi:uncharacterized membrane protein